MWLSATAVGVSELRAVSHNDGSFAKSTLGAEYDDWGHLVIVSLVEMRQTLPRATPGLISIG